MQSVQPNSELRDFRGLLMRDHAQLEAACEALRAAFNADARIESAQLWSELDARLRAHILLEEQVMLPAFSREHPREAARIRIEHDQIQKALTELAIGVDLHLARADFVEGFIARLRSHAALEDELMYGWAEHHLGHAERSTMLERLLARLQHTKAAHASRASH